jgi:hypothetical protein
VKKRSFRAHLPPCSPWRWYLPLSWYRSLRVPPTRRGAANPNPTGYLRHHRDLYREQRHSDRLDLNQYGQRDTHYTIASGATITTRFRVQRAAVASVWSAP